MMKFHPVKSIELGCCGAKWQHSHCLRNLVNNQSIPMCHSCGDEDVFRSCLQSNGIFVPEVALEQINVPNEQFSQAQFSLDSSCVPVTIDDSSSQGVSRANSCDVLSIATGSSDFLNVVTDNSAQSGSSQR